MKKFCKILLFFIVVVFYFDAGAELNFAHAKSESVVYAKVLNNCVLYKSQTMNESLDDKYFVIPESYFVTILEELPNDCFKVQYDKFIGYVKKDTVLIATFTPIIKSLQDIKCDIKQTSGTQIWNKPTVSGNVLTTIPAGTSEIEYIAMAYGEIPTGGVSNIWYYITYTPLSNSTNVYEGYVYSENVTNLSEILPNAESNPEIENTQNNETKNEVNVSSTFRTMVIALISVPIILLFSIIMYKIVKFVSKNANKRKNENNSDGGNYLQNNSDYEMRFSDENIYNNHTKPILKDEIDKMKETTFVKKISPDKFISKKSYPNFPIYDSEDDLL